MAITAETDTPLLPLTEATYRRLGSHIRPAPEESRWREIPWQTDLRDACRIATEARKPIFLWAMNGNPLGCT
jgi:hypothetical protein